jgi:hypothetical protein
MDKTMAFFKRRSEPDASSPIGGVSTDPKPTAGVDQPLEADRQATGTAPVPHRRHADAAPTPPRSSTGKGPKDLGRYAPPPEHAEALLDWLQGDNGRTGWIEACDLADAYREMCASLNLEAHGWAPVGAALRKLIKDAKRYRTRRGRRYRMWWIPPAPRLAASDGIIRRTA